MKKSSRAINVFSVSALDLFASALGAFILMSLIFMVFFTMTSKDSGEAEQTHTALERCEVQLAESVDASTLAQCEMRLANSVEASELAHCQMLLDASGDASNQVERVSEELKACQQTLKKTFVLVIASWSTRDDVDLHVVDPRGREFYFAQKTQPGTDAALEEDNIFGPGNEIWLHPSADSGRYRVCYKHFNGLSSPIVRGSILWQEGKIEIPNVTLTQVNQVKMAVEVIVDESGRVSVDRSRLGQVLSSGGCR
ncbi:MAG: hypothetical protein OXC84_03060 [Gammaproteobacteria bacterium]|nr:hypothetical protein [Gammaproteobacteria bacterium]